MEGVGRRPFGRHVAVEGDASGERADLLDGAIGELSMFHATFGYYAQGVVESTAILPTGWCDRLVPFATPTTGGVTALCLDPHDLWVSRAIAHRPKDIEFCAALLRENVVEPETLKARLSSVVDLPGKRRKAAESLLVRA